MILLEIYSRIVEETLLTRFNGAKPDAVELIAADFDGVTFHISNPDGDKSKIRVSICVKFFDQIKAIGAEDFILNEYKDHLCDVEGGYSFSILFDTEKLSGDKAALARKAALLKRNLFGSIFNKYFEHHAAGNIDAPKAVIPYRNNETIYITAAKDRVTAIFSTIFQDEDDIVLSKIFMQAFTEGKRAHGAPSVLFSHREPPLELQGTTAMSGNNVGYITFVLFPRHIDFKSREHTINMIHTFRNYLHYHIKCAKAYLHSRMRARTTEFLKVMNRAKPEPPKKAEKKTITNLKKEDILKSLKRSSRKQCKKSIDQELLSLDDFISLNPFPEILSLTLLEIALHSRDLECIEIDGTRVIKDGSTSTNGKYVFTMIEKCISNLKKLQLDNTNKEEITLLRFQLLYKMTDGKHITRNSQTNVSLEKSERMNREISRPLHAFSTTFLQHSELNREFCIILKDIWNEY